MWTQTGQLMDRAIEVSIASPREGLKLARKALRRIRTRCLRVHCAALIGNDLAKIERLQDAERIFGAAYRVADKCRCCLPTLDRNFAVLLSKRGQHDEAVEAATRAVETSPSAVECYISRSYRVFVLDAAGRPGAFADVDAVLSGLPPGSAYHDVALYNMAAILGKSRRLEELERAFELLPTIRFQGCEDVSLQRAHLSWLQGTVRLALAEHRPPATARQLRKAARDHLLTACRRFHALGLANLHAAAWADRAASLAMSARQTGSRKSFRRRIAHQDQRRPVPPPFGRFAAASLPILAGDPLPLRSFRESTGQAPPIVPYPSVSQ